MPLAPAGHHDRPTACRGHRRRPTNGTYTLTALATDTTGNTHLSAYRHRRTTGIHATTLVSGLTEPTDFRFLPDGRILIAQKTGAIQVANPTMASCRAHR